MGGGGEDVQERGDPFSPSSGATSFGGREMPIMHDILDT